MALPRISMSRKHGGSGAGAACFLGRFSPNEQEEVAMPIGLVGFSLASEGGIEVGHTHLG